MKLFIMTDLEGVAGVINGVDFLSYEGRYHETARRLLTLEVNAAIAAFSTGGFNDIVVADGHGHGAINIELLDSRARLLRGWGPKPYPFGLDRSYDACAYIGQHAKAGTPFSHLTHTGWWSLRDQKINGLSIGEYGEGVLCAGECGVPMIFASGEKAFCTEVQALTPWVVTAAVLEGAIGGNGEDLTGEQYERFHEGAIHLQPEAARALIGRKVKDACDQFRADRRRFELLKLAPPYVLERWRRPYHGQPAQQTRHEHPTSVIELFNSR